MNTTFISTPSFYIYIFWLWETQPEYTEVTSSVSGPPPERKQLSSAR